MKGSILRVKLAHDCMDVGGTNTGMCEVDNVRNILSRVTQDAVTEEARAENEVRNQSREGQGGGISTHHQPHLSI